MNGIEVSFFSLKSYDVKMCRPETRLREAWRRKPGGRFGELQGTLGFRLGK